MIGLGAEAETGTGLGAGTEADPTQGTVPETRGRRHGIPGTGAGTGTGGPTIGAGTRETGTGTAIGIETVRVRATIRATGVAAVTGPAGPRSGIGAARQSGGTPHGSGRSPASGRRRMSWPGRGRLGSGRRLEMGAEIGMPVEMLDGMVVGRGMRPGTEIQLEIERRPGTGRWSETGIGKWAGRRRLFCRGASRRMLSREVPQRLLMTPATSKSTGTVGICNVVSLLMK